MRPMLLIAALVATLPGGVRGCNAETCPGDALMMSMLDDPDLCGSRSTAVECQVFCPERADLLFWSREGLLEKTSYVNRKSEQGRIGRRRSGYWEFHLEPPTQMRFTLAPAEDGVPVAVPAAALRSSTRKLVVDETRMSVYLLASDIRQGCILDLASVWSWTLKKHDYALFAEDLEASVKVIGRRGSCPPADRTVPGKGEAWKIVGQLKRTS